MARKKVRIAALYRLPADFATRLRFLRPAGQRLVGLAGSVRARSGSTALVQLGGYRRRPA
jgi:hypothetical protein